MFWTETLQKVNYYFLNHQQTNVKWHSLTIYPSVAVSINRVNINGFTGHHVSGELFSFLAEGMFLFRCIDAVEPYLFSLAVMHNGYMVSPSVMPVTVPCQA